MNMHIVHIVATHLHVFNAFQTYKMDGKLKQRIEKGQQPRVVTKDKLPTNNVKSHTRKTLDGRTLSAKIRTFAK